MPNRWFLLGLLTPFLGVLSAALVLAWGLQPPQRPLQHVDPPSRYRVHGIDVSHHQGRIDWARVAASGRADFVFIKATEGVGHTDRRFRENWSEAREAGLVVGAYHYYSMCRPGAAQAAHFIRTVPKEADALPPVVDVEEDARCNRRPPDDLERQLSDYLDRLETHYGVRPLVYATPWYRSRYLPALRAGAWMAAYTRQPSPPWLFWQYTSRGRVDGVSLWVDRNVFHGDLEALHAMAGRS